ncbi:MAG: hypothetical protein QXG39_00260 [Candidatus Aenigmatarchaeota archaeon]
MKVKEFLDRVAEKLGKIGDLEQYQSEEERIAKQRWKGYIAILLISFLTLLILTSIVASAMAETVNLLMEIVGNMTVRDANFGQVFQGSTKCIDFLNSTNSGFWVAVKLLNATQTSTTQMFELSIKHKTDPTIPTQMIPMTGEWLNFTYSPGVYQICSKGLVIGKVEGLIEVQVQEGVNITKV